MELRDFQARIGQRAALVGGIALLFLAALGLADSFAAGEPTFVVRRVASTGWFAAGQIAACCAGGLYLVFTSLRKLNRLSKA